MAKKNVLDDIGDVKDPDLSFTSSDDAVQNTLDDIDGLSENSGVSISGRIYRVLSPADTSPGRCMTELVGVVDSFVDEDYVGRNYGPGRYKLRFRIKREGSKPIDRNVIFSVGREYEKFVKKNDVQPAGGRSSSMCSESGTSSTAGLVQSFLGSMTAEKVAGIVAAVEAVKSLLTPKQPDYMRLFEILARREEPKPAFSDSVVISAINSLKEKNTQPSIFEQIRDVSRLKDLLIKDEGDEKETEGDDMNFLLKTAFQYLPQLLAKNGNNYEEAGRQAASMPMVKDIVTNDPQLAKHFFVRARDRYGLEAAQQLARGFGLNLSEPKVQDVPGDYEGNDVEDSEQAI